MNKRLFLNLIGLTLVVMTFTICRSRSVVAFPHVSEKIENGELLVKQAYYDVNTGKVTIY